MPDLNLTCKECGDPYLLTESERGWFFQRGMQNPKKCPACRKSLRAKKHSRACESPRGVNIPNINIQKKSSPETSFGEKMVYEGEEWFIDQERIQEFVDAVETKKGFKPHYEKILRHMISELGELEAAIWKCEQSQAMGDLAPMWNYSFIKSKVGPELVDMISLCVYMATVLGINLNEVFPQRMKQIAEQYGV